jgi:uncharacterized protein YgfB (UPF0149 family)
VRWQPGRRSWLIAGAYDLTNEGVAFPQALSLICYSNLREITRPKRWKTTDFDVPIDDAG